MAERSSYADGEPCWTDLTTPDLDAAQRFYGAVFGWTFQGSGPEFGNYTMCLKDGRPVAGLAPPFPGTEPPARPLWTVYLATSDIGGTAAKIERAGGKLVMPPTEITGSGHMLTAVDPGDAPFGVWQAGDHRGSALSGEPGAPTYAEVAVRDGAAVDAFYRTVFGFEQDRLDDPAVDYSVWKLGGRPVCGRMQMTDDWGDLQPQWMVYFSVDDTDAAVQRIAEAGGTVTNGPFDTPYGRMAVFVDPHGAPASVIDESRRREQ